MLEAWHGGFRRQETPGPRGVGFAEAHDHEGDGLKKVMYLSFRGVWFGSRSIGSARNLDSRLSEKTVPGFS